MDSRSLRTAIDANEKADTLVNNGTQILALQSRATAFLSLKIIIKKQSNEQYKSI